MLVVTLQTEEDRRYPFIIDGIRGAHIRTVGLTQNPVIVRGDVIPSEVTERTYVFPFVPQSFFFQTDTNQLMYARLVPSEFEKGDNQYIEKPPLQDDDTYNPLSAYVGGQE